jgi:hypothetical protein
MLGALLAMGLAAPASAITEQDRQQAACANDVQRLCPEAIADPDEAQACMLKNRAQVSPKCAAMFPKKK